MTQQNLDLKGIIRPLMPMLSRKAVTAIGGFILGIGPTGLISQDQATQIATGLVGAATIVASAVWTRYLDNKTAVKLVAAASTGDPKADPTNPIVQQKIASAVANPLSPVMAKVES